MFFSSLWPAVLVPVGAASLVPWIYIVWQLASHPWLRLYLLLVILELNTRCLWDLVGEDWNKADIGSLSVSSCHLALDHLPSSATGLYFPCSNFHYCFSGRSLSPFIFCANFKSHGTLFNLSQSLHARVSKLLLGHLVPAYTLCIQPFCIVAPPRVPCFARPVSSYLSWVLGWTAEEQLEQSRESLEDVVCKNPRHLITYFFSLFELRFSISIATYNEFQTVCSYGDVGIKMYYITCCIPSVFLRKNM